MECGFEDEVVPSVTSSSEAKVVSNPHHNSVCLVGFDIGGPATTYHLL